ncbi:MAG: HNH endonuclease signature motif containing protein, partial [Pseudonocardiaceae bacterium]
GLARAQATAMARGQWRCAITDEHGRLLHSGITQARPLGWPTRTAGCRQIVELQIPATTLHELASDLTTLGGWAPVITNLAHLHTTAQQGPTADPTRRFPGTALRRHVQIRDRTCIMIGCRAPACGTDMDHTFDHAHGGSTTEPNLGNVCRHDHRLKHDGGWRLHQSKSGLFHWRSRLGHSYLLHPSTIIESLPDPIPRDGPAPPLFVPPDDDWDTSRIWNDTPAEADTKPPPGSLPEADAHHDAAPF